MEPGQESLANAIRTIEVPKARLLKITGQKLTVRLYGSAVLHRVLPSPVALRLAALRGRLEWHLSARRRREALQFAAWLRDSPADTPATRRFARRRLVEDAIQAELQWRPWLWRKLTVDGLHHLETARGVRGGRVVIATLHVGPYLGLLHALAAQGLKLYISQGDWSSESALHGRRGRWTREQTRWLEEAGCRFVPRGGSYPIFGALLERGECCVFAIDVRGQAALSIAGRPVRMRTGAASLALELRAPIVPALTLRRKWTQIATLFEPIDPTRFDDPVLLTQRILDVFGPAINADAEQIEVNLLALLSDSRPTPASAPGAAKSRAMRKRRVES
jgi:lauroyl/myristoyl acyltransferase